jgi:hypothetical protein
MVTPIVHGVQIKYHIMTVFVRLIMIQKTDLPEWGRM